jgi:tricarballylate dehydrogenase
MAKVRGTRYNTGDGLRMALDVGAQPYGQWSGCHSTAWERNAPEFGNVDEPHNGFRHSYPFGIVVNAEGKRFLDEGADFRGYTYAKYGRVILQQPGGFAWQVFDAQVKHLMRDEYRLRGATRAQADTLEELAARMQDVDANAFLQTVREFNATVKRDTHFDPNIKDGRSTIGLAVNKSNWATALEVPPFEAYSVGCGITFTFGGVKIDTGARVLDIDDAPLPGLYAAGEMVGGIFYFNYPGATGLMSSAVFGRIAGREAATFARSGVRH